MQTLAYLAVTTLAESLSGAGCLTCLWCCPRITSLGSPTGIMVTVDILVAWRTRVNEQPLSRRGSGEQRNGTVARRWWRRGERQQNMLYLFIMTAVVTCSIWHNNGSIFAFAPGAHSSVPSSFRISLFFAPYALCIYPLCAAVLKQ
jgi:hypothetical protein